MLIIILFIVAHVLFIVVVSNIGYLLVYAKFIVAATLVEYFWCLSNILRFLHVLLKILSNILGLSIVCWGFL